MNSLEEVGFLRVANSDDRNTIATILYKNGYKVSPCRVKKDGKSFQYLVKFQLVNPDDEEGGLLQNGS